MAKLQFYGLLLTAVLCISSVTPQFDGGCTSPEGAPGSCITIKECLPLLQLLRTIRSNPNVAQYLRQSLCGYQGKDPVVCCPAALQPIPSSPPEFVTEQPRPVNPPEVTEDQTSREEPSEPGICGFSNVTLPRVVGGVDAPLGAFPWIALLGYRSKRDPGTPRWLCGGTLISHRHVITAGHCIHNHENDLYLVRLGELDIVRDDDGATPVDVGVARLTKHPEYSPTTYTSDLGIITLSAPVAFTHLVSPICLPSSPALRSQSFRRFTPFLAGWGDTAFRGAQADHLQMVQLPVLDNEQCKQAYANFKTQVIDERIICAGRTGKDACQGDSGGPLMQPLPGENYRTQYHLLGVVSYGYKCAEPGYPGVYTRVTHFMSWIEEQLQQS